MFNAATPVQTTHMILVALMVAGVTVAVVVTPVQIGVGDWAARFSPSAGR